MLSICIPVYNYEVSSLVNTLRKQGEKSGIPFEIVLIDDSSSHKFRKANEKVGSEHKYILLDENIGRARIRNLFLKYVKFNKLLFLDCDSVIISDNFLNEYIREIRAENNIVYGGVVYDHNTVPRRNYRLRWDYGIKRESPSPLTRECSPFRYFKTNNFFVDRQILHEIKFEEKLVEYGYEDTLFAYELMKRGINVKHINNPVLHASEESNYEFIEKTEKSIYNLVKILKYVDYNSNFINNLRILKVSELISRIYLNRPVKLFFYVLRPAVRFLLIKGFAGLWVFDVYKLGLLKKESPRRITRGFFSI